MILKVFALGLLWFVVMAIFAIIIAVAEELILFFDRMWRQK